MSGGKGPEQVPQNPEELIEQATSIDDIIAIIVVENISVVSAGKLRSAEELAFALDATAQKLKDIEAGTLKLDKEAVLTELPRAYGIRRIVAKLEGIPYQD